MNKVLKYGLGVVGLGAAALGGYFAKDLGQKNYQAPAPVAQASGLTDIEQYDVRTADELLKAVQGHRDTQFTFNNKGSRVDRLDLRLGIDKRDGPVVTVVDERKTGQFGKGDSITVDFYKSGLRANSIGYLGVEDSFSSDIIAHWRKQESNNENARISRIDHEHRIQQVQKALRGR